MNEQEWLGGLQGGEKVILFDMNDGAFFSVGEVVPNKSKASVTVSMSNGAVHKFSRKTGMVSGLKGSRLFIHPYAAKEEERRLLLASL